jgi:hypothetical protein
VTRTRTTVELVPSTEVRNRTKTFIEDNLPRLLYRTRRAANDILMNGLSLAQPGVLINGAVHRRLNLCSTDINNIELTDLSSRNIQTLELLSGAINVHDWEVSSLCFCDWVGCIRNWGARWVVVRRAPQLRTMNRQAPRLLTPAPARRTRRKRTQRLHRLLARPTSLEAPPRHPRRLIMTPTAACSTTSSGPGPRPSFWSPATDSAGYNTSATRARNTHGPSLQTGPLPNAANPP